MDEDIDIRRSYQETGEVTGGLQSSHLAAAGGKPLMEVDESAPGGMRFNAPMGGDASLAAGTPPSMPLGTVPAQPMMAPAGAPAPPGTGAYPSVEPAMTAGLAPPPGYPPPPPTAAGSTITTTASNAAAMDRGDAYPAMGPDGSGSLGSQPTPVLMEGSQKGMGGQQPLLQVQGSNESSAMDTKPVAVPPQHGAGYAPFAAHAERAP